MKRKNIKIIMLISLFIFAFSTQIVLAGEEGFTITDFEGREVKFEKTPQRIISLAPSNTEILFALGLGDKIVGVTTFANYPEEALKKPRVGDVNPNLEKIAIQRPDVIFTMGGMEEVVDTLSRIGYKVVVINPECMEDIFSSILLIGRITDTFERAENLVNDLKERIGRVKEALKDINYRPDVFFEVWDNPLMTAGPGTFIDSLITMAGGRNIAADLKQSWAPYSFEQLLYQDPDIYLVTWEDKSRVLSRSGWENLTAVRQGSIYCINQDIISRPGPRMVDALEILAKIFHPEKF